MNNFYVFFTLIFITCSFDSMSTELRQNAVPLPAFGPRIYVERPDGLEENRVPVRSGEFSNLKVSPRLINNNIWQPSNLDEAFDEFDKLLPQEFIERFSSHYDAIELSKPEQIDNSVLDHDVSERLYDLSRYLINIWELRSDTRFAKQMQCITGNGFSLHNFYVLWAENSAINDGKTFSINVKSELYRIKSFLEQSGCHLNSEGHSIQN